MYRQLLPVAVWYPCDYHTSLEARVRWFLVMSDTRGPATVPSPCLALYNHCPDLPFIRGDAYFSKTYCEFRLQPIHDGENRPSTHKHRRRQPTPWWLQNYLFKCDYYETNSSSVHQRSIGLPASLISKQSANNQTYFSPNNHQHFNRFSTHILNRTFLFQSIIFHR